MRSTLERLDRNLTYTERECISLIRKELGNNNEGNLVISKLSEKITRSVFVQAVRALDIAGVLETRSLGAKGTYIKVLDQEVFNLI